MTVGSGTRPAPSATGSLASTPFANVLIYTRNKRLTGTLALRSVEEGRGRDATIQFWRGRIRRVAISPPILPLGTILQMLQQVDKATLDLALAEAIPQKKLIGEVLVARGAITAEQRDKALIEQASRRVYDLFALPESTIYGFYDGQAEVESPPNLLEPLVPVWRGLKDVPPKDVEGIIARVGTSPLRLVNEGALYNVDFDPEERRIVQSLSARPMTLGELRAKLGQQRVDLVGYFLLISKCAEIAPASAATSLPPTQSPDIMASLPPKRQAAKPINAPPSRPSAPDHQIVLPTFRIPSNTAITRPNVPAARSNPSKPVDAGAPAAPAKTLPSPTELGPDGIRARAAIIESVSLFEVLGVADGASIEAVRSAYIRLAKLWHPDRLARDLESAKPAVATVFAQMSRAHDTLTNPQARAAHIALTLDVASRATRRVSSLKLADEALARRDFFVVEREARVIHGDDPNDADALALLAWCAALAGLAPDPVLRSALAILDRAAATNPSCERAHLYRGLIWKRLGDFSAASADFKHVLQLNPRNSQAEREAAATGARLSGTALKHQAPPPAKTKT